MGLELFIAVSVFPEELLAYQELMPCKFDQDSSIYVPFTYLFCHLFRKKWWNRVLWMGCGTFRRLAESF